MFNHLKDTSQKLIALSIACLGYHAAYAEGLQLEEIVVTAQKRETNLQDTAVSVAVVGGESVAVAPVSDLETALGGVPSLNFVSQGNFGLVVTARGVGPSTVGGQAGVSTLYDNVYSSSQVMPRAGFYDVSRFEVLLGPQGTLYGRNAQGGVVHVITNDPHRDYEANLSFGVGNYSLQNSQFAVNLPLTETLALRVAGTSNKRDGYLSSGHEDNGTTSVRAKLLYEPSEVVSALLGAEITKIDEVGQAQVANFVNADDDIRDTDYPRRSYYRTQAKKLWAKIDVDVGWADLTVIPAYVKTDEAEEETFTSAFEQINNGLGHIEEKSLELRLQSTASSPFNWIVGAYGYDMEDISPKGEFREGLSVVNGSIVLADGYQAALMLKEEASTGVFGQVEIPLTSSLTLIAGARHSEDERRIFNDGEASTGSSVAVSSFTDQEVNYSRSDYKLGLQYLVSDETMAYFLHATGYRPGGFTDAAPFYAPYGIEEVSSFEFGLKSELLDNSLRLNAALFAYDYTDYQLSNIQECGAAPLPACTGTVPGANLTVENADAEVFGAELNIEYLPSDYDKFDFALAYNDSEITEDLPMGVPAFIPGVGLVVQEVNQKGGELPQAPKVSLSANYSHVFELSSGTLIPMVSWSYQSEKVLGLPVDDNKRQDAVSKYDAQLGYEPKGSDWRFNLWIRNITDEIVKDSVVGRGTTLAAPRTFGASISARFD